ncbi:MAG: hypothetical protein QNJ77_04190 [Acidimicrobiia bacterium]|nr:hypothetical protein [Acidimicrobiia bacterium]
MRSTIFLVVAMVAAGACGGEDDTTAATSTTTATTATTATSTTEAPSTTTTTTLAVAERLAVTFFVEMDASLRGGSFTASGPAVDAGLFCESGSAGDLDALEARREEWNTRLKCAGSGVTLEVSVGEWTYEGTDEITSGTWVLSTGTGPYEGLTGEGEASIKFSAGFHDEFTGEIWREAG